MLIDTGNGGAQAARDAGRIMEAAKDAGVTKIDHLIFTHWHGDHFGGLADSRNRSRSPTTTTTVRTCRPTPATDEFFKTVYEPLTAKAAHTVVKPGDSIPVKDLELESRRLRWQRAEDEPVRRRPPNPYCAESTPAGCRIRPRTRSR